MAIRRSRDGFGLVVSDITTTDGLGEKLGAQVCSNVLENGELPVGTWKYAAAAGGIVSSTAGVTIATAPAAGVSNYIKSLQIGTDTLGAATELVIRDGAAGTVIWRIKLQTQALPADTINFDPPIKGTAATLLEIAALTSVTGGIFVNAQGYTAS
jgi:hypothetical protein